MTKADKQNRSYKKACTVICKIYHIFLGPYKYDHISKLSDKLTTCPYKIMNMSIEVVLPRGLCSSGFSARLCEW